MTVANSPLSASETPHENGVALVDAASEAFRASLGVLQGIERDFRAAIETTHGDDARLGTCLERLHSAITQQEQELTPLFAEWKAAANGSAGCPADPVTPSQVDPTTGLPERSLAEAAVAAAISGERPAYAAVFVLERLDVINARFGYKAGDSMFQLYVRDLTGQLPGEDRLYRWTGPAVVVLMERTEPFLRVRGEVFRITGRRFSSTLDMGSRCALLSIGAKANVVSLAGATAESAIEELDAFVQSNLPGKAQSD